MSAGTYSDFLRALGQNESGNNYAFVSSAGYLGRFQFGEEALQVIGFYNGDHTTALDFIGGWTSKAGGYGAWSKESFLASPAAQDAAAEAWFVKVNADIDALGLKSYIGQTVGGVYITQSGLMAGTHLVGVWALKSYLQSGGAVNTVDYYGTPVSHYVQKFGGYDTPFSAPAPQPAAPPPPPPPPPTGGASNDVVAIGQGSEVHTGGAGADRFVVAKEPWSPSRITDFALGEDKLDLSALFQQAGYTGSDPVADRYVSFLDDGAGGVKILFDRDGAAGGQPWPNYILHLEKVAAGGLTWAKLSGDAAAPPAPAPSQAPASGPVLTATHAGAVVQGGAGAETLIGHAGGGALVGGGGADLFVFKSEPWSPTRIADFQLGTDKLDLSALFSASGYAGADPVADKYVSFMNDGAGGTWLHFDRDGAAQGQPWPSYVIHLQNVPAAGLTWGALSAPGGAVTSGGGSTTPTGGETARPVAVNGASLSGGAGADRFVFDDLPWLPAKLSGFTPGVDKLDVRGMLDDVGYAGTDAVRDGYLRLEDNGQGGTWVHLDRDGAAAGDRWGTFFANLEGVRPHQLTAGDWLFQ